MKLLKSFPFLLLSASLCLAQGEPAGVKAFEEMLLKALGPLQQKRVPDYFDEKLDWSKVNPIEFLELLQERERWSGPVPMFTVSSAPPSGWIKEAHVESLLKLIQSEKPAAHVVSSLSSHLPSKNSTVGVQAMFLIEGFKQGRYPPSLSSEDFKGKPAEYRKWSARSAGNVTPTSDVRAQDPGSVKRDEPRRLTDEEIIRQAVDLTRRAWRGGEGVAGAAGGLTRLLKDNPDAITTPLLQAALDGIRERQAANHLAIAMYYFDNRGNARAAESRLREIVHGYPGYSRMDDVLYQLSVIEYESGRRTEAITTLEKLVNEFKVSPRAKEALARLKTYKVSR